MKKGKKITAAVLASVLVLQTGACSKKEEVLDAKNPVTVTVWTYYSGYQQTAFEEMVTKFNEGVGKKEGIVVESVAQGSIDGLVEELNKSVEGKAGAQELPDAVCIYPDTASELEEKDVLIALDEYFTKEELEKYVDNFIEEGRFTEGGELKLIPVSKSTELMIYNKTDFDKFALETGVTVEDMQTMEKMVEVSEKYYQWTDSLTPDIAEDGKAFFGRDSLENYIILGSAQLGHPVLTLDDNNQGQCTLDKETMRTLWDNYYVPYINGYFGAYGKFRSDDAKLGKLLVSVGSSSGVNYFPTEVTLEDDTTYAIEVGIYEAPGFEGGQNLMAQQGAGFGVVGSDEASQYATVQFLKWITQKEQNMEFAIGANYMPVLKESVDKKTLETYFENQTGMSAALKESMLLCSEIIQEDQFLVSKPFENYSDIRTYLAKQLQSIADADRTKVIELIQSGMSREEAVKDFVTDQYFDIWYENLVEETKLIMSEEK